MQVNFVQEIPCVLNFKHLLDKKKYPFGHELVSTILQNKIQ